MSAIIAYPGGIISTAPAQNKSYEADDATQTVTTWDTAGNVTGTRAYTAEEVAAMQAQQAAAAAAAAVDVAQSNVATMVGQLPTLLSQAQSDLTLWQGISTPAQLTDGHIASLIRRQDGWVQVIEGLWNLMTTMGVAPPRT